MKRSFTHLLSTTLVLSSLFFWTGASLADEVRPLTEKERMEYALLSPFEFKNVLGDAAKSSGKPFKPPDGSYAGCRYPPFIPTAASRARTLTSLR